MLCFYEACWSIPNSSRDLFNVCKKESTFIGHPRTMSSTCHLVEFPESLFAIIEVTQDRAVREVAVEVLNWLGWPERGSDLPLLAPTLAAGLRRVLRLSALRSTRNSKLMC